MGEPRLFGKTYRVTASDPEAETILICLGDVATKIDVPVMDRWILSWFEAYHWGEDFPGSEYQEDSMKEGGRYLSADEFDAIKASEAQVIDGIFDGYKDNQWYIRMHCLDSSWWDITCNDPAVLEKLAEWDDAEEVDQKDVDLD